MSDEARDPQSTPPGSPAGRLEGAEIPPPDEEADYPPRWGTEPRRSRFGWIGRAVMLLLVLALLAGTVLKLKVFGGPQ